MNKVTNKLTGVLKYHRNDQLRKSEIVEFDDLNVIGAADKLCIWIGELHVIAQFLFEYKGYNMRVRKVALEAATKLFNEGIITHSDTIYTQNAGRLEVTTGFRKVDGEKDGVYCNNKTLSFYIDFTIQSYASDDIDKFSMLLISDDNIKTLN